MQRNGASSWCDWLLYHLKCRLCQSTESRSGHGHHQGRGDALACHVADDDLQWRIVVSLSAEFVENQEIVKVATHLASGTEPRGELEPTGPAGEPLGQQPL